MPTVGGKFASRAGEKGTMSLACPFSESGMVPDILFNPNGFPGRMAIGLIVVFCQGRQGQYTDILMTRNRFRLTKKTERWTISAKN